MNKNITITIDLAATIFQIAVFNKSGNVILNKDVNERNMLIIVDKYPEASILLMSPYTTYIMTTALRAMQKYRSCFMFRPFLAISATASCVALVSYIHVRTWLHDISASMYVDAKE